MPQISIPDFTHLPALTILNFLAYSTKIAYRIKDMKIFKSVGLISILCGCISKPSSPSKLDNIAPPAPVVSRYNRDSVLKIKLNSIERNGDFKISQTDTFRYLSAAEVDLQLRRILFKNSQEAKLYLQYRKVFLDQTFKNNIAPYFGVIKIEPACYALAKTAAVEKSTSLMTTFFMEFPMTNRMVISECIGGPLAGIVRYDIFHCRKTNAVYELRDFRKIDQAALKLEVECK